ncbi:MAG: hypothetical protein IPJ22_15440 [Bacteroidetes bacterium]|jgi:hypothetical protein|nr:hypothetical protein [Bacteroidota bacterium]MBP7256140.1 hypothetical protein [Chitinophagales bacterium]MBP9135804.1 hypothetical protein [Chitinophagales bacterium]
MGLFLYVATWKILFLKDLFLGPLCLILIYIWAYGYKKKNYSKFAYAKYFIPALTVRMVGAFLTALMYQFYYHSGDPFSYWLCVKYIWDNIFISPETYLNILFRTFENYSIETMEVLNGLDYNSFFREPSTNIVIRVSLFFSLFSNNTFMPVSFLITLFAFLGSWKLFLTFYDLYPQYMREIAIATLFVPSVFFWGTGVMKDPLCIGALGYLTYSSYQLFLKRKFSIISVIWLIVGTIIIASVKTYIIMAYAPALVIWIVLKYWKNIKSKAVKIFAGPLFIALALGGGILVLSQFSSLGQKYSLESLKSTAQSTQQWLTIVSENENGSSYNLGEIDYTTFGILKVFPKAVNVTLFRPYIWETRKPILIPAALESLFCLLFTMYIFFKVGFFKTIRAILGNPDLLFCLIFTLVFAFAVGFSTFNFGALVRYKIPCLPFYFLFIFILYKENYKSIIKKKKSINTK